MSTHTGEILLVGDKHIEHNINTFKGCAGAVAFLLDKDQPLSLDRHLDIGKTIAVHVGSHPSIRTRNAGFRLGPSISSSFAKPDVKRKKISPYY